MAWLIVGLGNPGVQYCDTRHNVGFWFLDRLATTYGYTMKEKKDFFGQIARIKLGSTDVWLLMPNTYMNNSGRSVKAVSDFYKLMPEQTLIVHDDIDLPVGVGRLKTGGGSGGHNGLKSIISVFGNNFFRLRLGVDHPGHAEDVVQWVLNKPLTGDAKRIRQLIEESIELMPLLFLEDKQTFVQKLHTIRL